ncbi:hypothetical protein EDC56_1169 [Sinobacterium caligoides]|uniref:Choice-of-anchor I domain-containing protein n=1 Tax=Sinobacterium caligoides TaxID=933926 RepID=A0A3N2E0I8_9GAMM|nr:choice-of-anchor I family protein [Sinobacterium caligoides]ROS05623.1 hypothetical protein EDC56_1169 [Sinobacterium caligoides]
MLSAAKKFNAAKKNAPLFCKRNFLLASTLLMISGCGSDGSDNTPVPPPTPTPAPEPAPAPAPTDPSMTLIGRFNDGQQLDQGMAEIVSFHAASQSILVINAAASRVDILDASELDSEALSEPTSNSNLSRRSQLDVGADVEQAVTGFTSGGINSVAVNGNLMAVAVENDARQADGFIAFYQLDNLGAATFISAVEAGALPDNVQISSDGRWVVSANEGEPSGDYSNDPEGSISVIAVTDGSPASEASQLRFNEFNSDGSRAAELPAGVRISHPGATVAQDLEPEYVAFSADNSTAYVSLQENNAIAVIDLDNPHIERIFALGSIDHGAVDNGLDASNKDACDEDDIADGKCSTVNDGINIRRYQHLYGLPMPDSIASYSLNDTRYVVTANEGDSREYSYSTDEASCEAAGHDYDDGSCFSWVDEKRIGKLDLDASIFDSSLQDNAQLGRLKVMRDQGRNASGEYEALYAFGGRSFSIFNADSGERVFNSGDDFEQITATQLGSQGFNNNNDENAFDNRSDDKGPEPEALAIGLIDERHYAFIGLERTGGIMLYDITEPSSPRFLEYTLNRNLDSDIENELASAGDLGPEGMKFVEAAHSPTGHPLLLVGNEVSGTTSVYEIK